MYSFPEKSPALNLRSANINLILFSMVIFIYGVGDAIMSFMAPNIIQNFIHNTFLMGVIFSTSSFVGYFADMALGNLVKERTFIWYLSMGMLLAVIFPLVLLPASLSIFSLILAMATWGIYYELIVFSKSNYIHHCLSHDKHDVAWATINAFMSVAYLIGPSIAVVLLEKHPNFPQIAAIIIQLLAFFGLIVYKLIFSKEIKNPMSQAHQPSFKAGLATWKLLNLRLWPLLLFTFSLTFIDATFWTIGAVLVDREAAAHPVASLFFVFYLLPGLIVSPLGVKLSKRFGKKRTAFCCGLGAGLAFIPIFFTQDFNLFLLLIALGSLGLSIALPEIHGAIEDYCERLGESANSLVGLISSIGSLAYVVGPIAAGGIAMFIGESKTFAVIGLLMFVTSLTALLLVPRKVRLPQRQIQAVLKPAVIQ